MECSNILYEMGVHVVDSIWWHENIKPYDVLPGSYAGEGHEGDVRRAATVFSSLVHGHELENLGNGVYQRSAFQWGWRSGTGMTVRVESDGTHFCFIPVFSGLDYPIQDWWEDIENDAISYKTVVNPFHVISGITEGYYDRRIDTSNLTPPIPIELREFVFRRQFNKPHFYVKNPPIGQYRNGEYDDTENWYEYPNCDTTLPPDIVIRTLNREIGDDTLWVENRTMPYTANYDAERYIGVNENSPLYEYNNGLGIGAIGIPGIYSKSEPFLHNGPGTAVFFARNANVTFNGPASNPVTADTIDWVKCCENFRPDEVWRVAPAESKFATNENADILLYPNPLHPLEELRVRFINKAPSSIYKVSITDILGRHYAIKPFRNINGELIINLNNTPSGFYFLRIYTNIKNYENKLIITEK